MLPFLSYVQEWSSDISYIKHSFVIVCDQIGDPFQYTKMKNIHRIYGNGSFTSHAPAINNTDDFWHTLLFGGKYNGAPSIYEQTRKQYPNSKLGFYSNYEGFDHNVQNVDIYSTNDYKKMAQAGIEYILKNKPTLMFLHLPAPKQFTTVDDEYLSYLKEIDKLVGNILDAIYEGNMMNESHIILTTGTSVDSDNVIWTCQGPFVPLNAEIIVPVNLADTTMTTAYSLDLEMSSLWAGNVPYLGDGTAPANRVVTNAIRGILLTCGIAIIMAMAFSYIKKIDDEHVQLSTNPNISRTISFSAGMTWLGPSWSDEE